jgi:hypothetical protein
LTIQPVNVIFINEKGGNMKLNIRNNKKLLISLIVVTVYLILSFTILFIGLYSKNTITDIENGDKRVANSINVFTKENN